jgi:hypothetical protein
VLPFFGYVNSVSATLALRASLSPLRGSREKALFRYAKVAFSKDGAVIRCIYVVYMRFKLTNWSNL